MTEKMSLALTLLHDPNTLRTYEDFARKSAYETKGAQTSPSNSPNQRHQHRETPTERSMRTGLPNHDHGRTPPGATNMDVDQDSHEQTHPQGTPFDDDYITSITRRGVPTADPPTGIQTGNFYTLIYT